MTCNDGGALSPLQAPIWFVLAQLTGVPSKCDDREAPGLTAQVRSSYALMDTMDTMRACRWAAALSLLRCNHSPTCCYCSCRSEWQGRRGHKDGKQSDKA
eukprot:jgi/Ulvmu1/11387/UM075_0049.1